MSDPLTDRLTNGWIWIAAGFTLAAQAVVFAGGSLRALAWATGVAAVAGAALHLGLGTGRAGRPPPGPDARSAPGPPAPAGGSGEERDGAAPGIGVRVLVALLAAGVAGVGVGLGRIEWAWGGAAAIALVLAAAELRRPLPRGAALAAAGGAPPSAGPGGAVLLAGLGLAAAAFTLAAHRPDADDAFYLNLAVAAVDEPAMRLLHGDTLHGVPGVPLPLPVYRVHALEPAIALLAWATPLRVVDVAHLLLPALAAFAVPFAHARLLRRLLPARWPVAVTALLAVLALAGGVHGSYGNFAFVRLHQGKALLLTLMLPLVAATALEYALDPRPRRWLRLAAAQVAAVGTSATALWAAPAVAGVVLLVGFEVRTAALRRTLVGLAASVHPLALAAALLATTAGAFAASPADWSERADFAVAFDFVLGDGLGAAAALFLLAGTWALAPTALARRFAAIVPAAFLAVFWSPLTADAVARFVTGPPTYWRVFWVLPLPALAAIAAATPVGGPGAPAWRRALGAAVAATVLLAVLREPTWREANRVRLAAPGWKIPPDELASARALRDAAGPGELVLAPPGVAQWVVVLHRHPTPLVVRPLYLTVLRGHRPAAELERREAWARLVAGQERDAAFAASLGEAIGTLPLAAVCVAPRAARWPELRAVLERSPLAPRPASGACALWARPR